MSEDSELEETLVATIRLPDLGDAVADLGEAGLDRLMEEGLVRDIPVIGTVIRLRRTFGVVRDFVFARKIVRFLKGIARIPDVEREAFVARLSAPQERRRVGETLVLLLDRLDDIEKPEILARLFAGYVRGTYDFTTFRRLSSALDRLSLPALPQLRAFYAPEHEGFALDGDDLAHLAAAGLVAVQFFPGTIGGSGGSFRTTELGRLFLETIHAPPKKLLSGTTKKRPLTRPRRSRG